jgi:hypothetical protein
MPSKLEASKDEIDRVLGAGYAAAHPELHAAALISASLDDAAVLICAASGGRSCGNSRATVWVGRRLLQPISPNRASGAFASTAGRTKSMG